MRTGKTRRTGIWAAVAAIGAVAIQFMPAGAVAPTGPSPATTNAVSLVASPVDNLGNGTAITYHVTTSGSTRLIGTITAHLCTHGLSGYGTSNFGYSGGQGTRCVYAPGIFTGGLSGADYESISLPYDGTATSSGSLTFHAGTGSVGWGNVTGQGPFTLQCDAAHQCDLVVQVNLSGDSVATTYFVQPLSFAADGSTTTGSSATPSTTPVTTAMTAASTTTTTVSTTTTLASTTTSTTTTTLAATTTTGDVTSTSVSTTTTAPDSTSTTSTVPATITPLGSSTPSGGSGGSTLPFTGGSVRDVASAGLLFLSLGLFLLAQHHRRNEHWL